MTDAQLTTRLKPQMPAPDLHLQLVNGGDWHLQEQSPQSFTLIAFYRGYHCPQCSLHLRDIDRNYDAFQSLGIDVIAVSTNPQELAEKTAAEWELENIPVAYGFSLDDARDWGLYLSDSIKPSEPERFSEPALYVINPDATVYGAIIQTMPFARMSSKVLLGGLGEIIRINYPARGEV